MYYIKKNIKYRFCDFKSKIFFKILVSYYILLIKSDNIEIEFYYNKFIIINKFEVTLMKILWYGYFVIYLIFTSLWRIKLSVLKKRSKHDAELYAFEKAKQISKHVIKMSKTSSDIKGLTNIPEGPCLFVANHQAIFDAFLMAAFIDKPFGFIAKKEIESLPLISSWLRDINSVFLDRENVRESIKVINKGIENLKSGYSMAIFPEGTRSLKSEMREFKKGSMKLALKAGVPIVPITLDGTYRVLEVGKKVSGHTIKMVVHKPIYVDKLTREEQGELASIVHKIIEEELIQIR